MSGRSSGEDADDTRRDDRPPRPDWATGLARGFLLKEAIASVAIEHTRGCACDVCRAARGDVAAFARVWQQAYPDAP